jgi:hypothetical protein
VVGAATAVLGGGWWGQGGSGGGQGGGGRAVFFCFIKISSPRAGWASRRMPTIRGGAKGGA